MKGEKIKHCIEMALRQLLGVENHFKTTDIMYAHEKAALDELDQLITENQELKEQLINSENQRKMLIDEVEKLKEEKLLIKLDVESLQQHYKTAKEVAKSYKQMFEEQKELVELGEAVEWYYTECDSFYTITGARLSKKRKYELLKERILNDFRQQKEDK